MPYSPPAGNAANFNFSGSYSAPAGHSIVFNFGGIAPPTPSLAAPTGLRQARLYEDDWRFDRRSRFAPITDDQPIALRHRGLASFRLEQEQPWSQPRRQIRFQPPSRRRRRMLFTIT